MKNYNIPVHQEYLRMIAFVFILLAFQIPLIAQITIESSDMPSPGDTVRLSTGLNTDFIDYTETGENFVWNFSQLIPVIQTVDTFVPPSETPFYYQIFFALYSNLAHRYMRDIPIPGFELTDIYYYFKNESSKFSNIGYAVSISGFPIPIRFDHPDVFYRFPLHYGDVDSSASHFAFGVDDFGYVLIDRTRKNKVDGWGTITTPFGTFETLRIKSDVHEFDSIYIDSLQMGIPLDRYYTEYKWLAKGQKEPVLQITTDYLGGAVVVYRDSARMNLNAVHEYTIGENTMAVYPNPASSVLFVEFDLLQASVVDLSVTDISGKQLFHRKITGRTGFNRTTLNLNSLTLKGGMCLINLAAGTQVVTKKLIVKN